MTMHIGPICTICDKFFVFNPFFSCICLGAYGAVLIQNIGKKITYSQLPTFIRGSLFCATSFFFCFYFCVVCFSGVSRRLPKTTFYVYLLLHVLSGWFVEIYSIYLLTTTSTRLVHLYHLQKKPKVIEIFLKLFCQNSKRI